MINQLRMIIAEWLLSLASNIAPHKTEEGMRLIATVYSYMQQELQRFKKKED